MGWGGVGWAVFTSITGLYKLVVAQVQKKSVTFPTVLESKRSEQALSPEDGNFSHILLIWVHIHVGMFC